MLWVNGMVLLLPVPLQVPTVKIQIWTAACGWGWGSVCDGIKESGTWQPDIVFEHIN